MGCENVKLFLREPLVLRRTPALHAFPLMAYSSFAIVGIRLKLFVKNCENAADHTIKPETPK